MSSTPANRYHLPLHVGPSVRRLEEDEEPEVTRKRADSWYLRLFNLHAGQSGPNTDSPATQPPSTTSRISHSTQVLPSRFEWEDDDDAVDHSQAFFNTPVTNGGESVRASSFAFSLFGVSPPPQSPRLDKKASLPKTRRRTKTEHQDTLLLSPTIMKHRTLLLEQQASPRYLSPASTVHTPSTAPPPSGPSDYRRIKTGPRVSLLQPNSPPAFQRAQSAAVNANSH